MMDKKYLARAMIVCLVVFTLSGCTKQAGEVHHYEQMTPPVEGDSILVLETNYGTIQIKLFSEITPIHIDYLKQFIQEDIYRGAELYPVDRSLAHAVSLNPAVDTGYDERVIGTDNPNEFHHEYRMYGGAVGFGKRNREFLSSSLFMVAPQPLENTYLEELKALGEDYYPQKAIDGYKRFGGDPRGDINYTVIGQIFEGLEIVKGIYEQSLDMNLMIYEDPVVILKAQVESYSKGED